MFAAPPIIASFATPIPPAVMNEAKLAEAALVVSLIETLPPNVAVVAIAILLAVACPIMVAVVAVNKLPTNRLLPIVALVFTVKLFNVKLVAVTFASVVPPDTTRSLAIDVPPAIVTAMAELVDNVEVLVTCNVTKLEVVPVTPARVACCATDSVPATDTFPKMFALVAVNTVAVNAATIDVPVTVRLVNVTLTAVKFPRLVVPVDVIPPLALNVDPPMVNPPVTDKVTIVAVVMVAVDILARPVTTKSFSVVVVKTFKFPLTTWLPNTVNVVAVSVVAVVAPSTEFPVIDKLVAVTVPPNVALPTAFNPTPALDKVIATNEAVVALSTIVPDVPPNDSCPTTLMFPPMLTSFLIPTPPATVNAPVFVSVLLVIPVTAMLSALSFSVDVDHVKFVAKLVFPASDWNGICPARPP